MIQRSGRRSESLSSALEIHPHFLYFLEISEAIKKQIYYDDDRVHDDDDDDFDDNYDDDDEDDDDENYYPPILPL